MYKTSLAFLILCVSVFSLCLVSHPKGSNDRMETEICKSEKVHTSSDHKEKERRRKKKQYWRNEHELSEKVKLVHERQRKKEVVSFKSDQGAAAMKQLK